MATLIESASREANKQSGIESINPKEGINMNELSDDKPYSSQANVLTTNHPLYIMVKQHRVLFSFLRRHFCTLYTLSLISLGL